MVIIILKFLGSVKLFSSQLSFFLMNYLHSIDIVSVVIEIYLCPCD